MPKLFKLTIRTASGFEYTYQHVASIRYASPRHIDFVSFDMIHTRIWSDDVTSLFYDITMEVEENDQTQAHE